MSTDAPTARQLAERLHGLQREGRRLRRYVVVERVEDIERDVGQLHPQPADRRELARALDEVEASLRRARWAASRIN